MHSAEVRFLAPVYHPNLVKDGKRKKESISSDF